MLPHTHGREGRGRRRRSLGPALDRNAACFMQPNVVVAVLFVVRNYGDMIELTENDGHENDGPSKFQDMKLQDMKLRDQMTGHEIAGHENARHVSCNFMSCTFTSCNFLSYIFLSCIFMSCYFVRHFHVLQFHSLQLGPSISCLAISCPLFSAPRHDKPILSISNDRELTPDCVPGIAVRLHESVRLRHQARWSETETGRSDGRAEVTSTVTDTRGT